MKDLKAIFAHKDQCLIYLYMLYIYTQTHIHKTHNRRYTRIPILYFRLIKVSLQQLTVKEQYMYIH